MISKRPQLRFLIPALALLSISALLLAQSRSTQAAESKTTPARTLAVSDVVVELSPGYGARESYNGRVVSRRSSQLGFTIGGRLLEVLVDEGERVEADQVLAHIDSAKLRAMRREIEAQIHEIEARLELAKLTQKRTTTLADKDSVSKQRYDEARFEVMALEARLEAARAGIEGIDVDIEFAQLRAPYSGSITRRFVDEGTIVAPGQEVLRIIEANALEARFGVSPATAERLKIGQRHALHVGDRELEATLSALMDDVARETRTVTAIFEIALEIKDPELEIRHGSLARLDLVVRHETAGFWLPISALAESRRGLWSAYALVADERNSSLYRIDRRELQLIHTESDRAFMRGTLEDGERVVSTGLHRLVPGQQVRLAGEAR